MPRVSMPEPRVSRRETPTVYLNFGNKDTPKEFTDLSLNDEVMVVMRGKVMSLGQHQEGAALEVAYNQLEIVGDAKPKTMSEVLAQLRGGQ